MSRSIILNSNESLPIPPRNSSRTQASSPIKPSPSKDTRSPSEIIKTSYLSSTPGSTHNSPTPGRIADTSDPSAASPALSGHSRSPSHLRKAVPAYLPSPPVATETDFPADHPFSAARMGGAGKNGEDASIRSLASGSDGTPGWRDDKDLFFSSGFKQPVNTVTSLPPPPRKSNLRRPPGQSSSIHSSSNSPATSSVHVPISLEKPIQTSSVLDQRRGTFSGGLNIDVPGMDPEAGSSRITHEAVETLTQEPTERDTTRCTPPAKKSSSSRDVTPTGTPRSKVEGTPNYDRPLPPLPYAPSVASLGMSSILASGPPGDDGRSSHTRSISGMSSNAPSTPRLESLPPSSAARTSVMSNGTTPASKEKGHSALGGKKFPWQKKKTEKNGGEGDEEGFSVSRTPSKRQLWEAGTHFLRDEEGGLVYFGDLFPKWDQDSSVPPPSHTKAEVASLKGSLASLRPPPEATSSGKNESDPSRPPPRTVVFFIRFFWCGQCQDYMFASICQLDQEALAKANIRVVIISNGSWKFIKDYRKLTKCPFPVYVDASRAIYGLLGMTSQAMNWGPWFKGRAAYNQSSVPSQIMQSFTNAPKLPMTSNPGNMNQMGGEFILEPGFECSFAHRMTNYSNHMEAADLCRLAGCSAPTKSETEQNQLQEAEQAELARLQTEMDQWRTGRESELDRIRRKKAERRGLPYNPSAADRRGSNVSAIPGLAPVLDVSIDEANGQMDEIEVIVADAEAEAEEIDSKRMSDGQLDEEFERAMQIEEKAKDRFEAGRTGPGVGVAQ